MWIKLTEICSLSLFALTLEYRGRLADMFTAQRMQQSGYIRQPVDRAPVPVFGRTELFHVVGSYRRTHHHRQDASIQGECQVSFV